MYSKASRSAIAAHWRNFVPPLVLMDGSGMVGLSEPIRQVWIEMPLVLLHRQHLIGCVVHNGLGDLRLAAPRIKRDHAARPIQDFQQGGIAVISLDFPSTVRCPKAIPLPVAQA